MFKRLAAFGMAAFFPRPEDLGDPDEKGYAQCIETAMSVCTYVHICSHPGVERKCDLRRNHDMFLIYPIFHLLQDSCVYTHR